MISAPLSLMTSCGDDDVADRLRHLAAFEVDQEAVRQHLLVGRPPARGQRHQQRALEPAAVLVAAFEIHVGRPAEAARGAAARPRGSSPSRTRRRGCPARARRSALPHFGHVKPSGRNSSIGALVPRVGAVDARRRGRAIDQRRREHRLAARRAVHRRNRHAPGALARDAPVGPVRHHVVDAVAAPRGIHCTWWSIACCAASRSVRRSPSSQVMAGSPSMRTNHCDGGAGR